MTPFAQRVYEKLREVPAGKVTTYKDLALAIGSGAFRAVGQVLRNNPNAPTAPCHRVVSSDGKIGGYFGQKEGIAIKKKRALLEREGVHVANGKIKDFTHHRYEFS